MGLAMAMVMAMARASITPHHWFAATTTTTTTTTTGTGCRPDLPRVLPIHIRYYYRAGDNLLLLCILLRVGHPAQIDIPRTQGPRNYLPHDDHIPNGQQNCHSMAEWLNVRMRQAATTNPADGDYHIRPLRSCQAYSGTGGVVDDGDGYV